MDDIFNNIPTTDGGDSTPEQPDIIISSANTVPPVTPTNEPTPTEHAEIPQPYFVAEAPKPQKEKLIRKGKTNVGRLIFISLICISLAVTALTLGITFTQSDVVVKDTTAISDEATDETQRVPVSLNGATPQLQESPLVFEEYDGTGSMTPQQVYDNVKDINVGILVYQRGTMIGEGSGIIVGEDDNHTYTYIITAAHVICDSNIEIQVQFSDESTIEGTIIGFDEKTDIGVIRVKKTGLKAAVFGNSSTLVVGQAVYAIGNPGGTEFFGSFTSGMVSAIDRPIPTQNNGLYDLPCIQHNAAINPGNSGGALVNEFGQVIGLNSSKISSTEYEGMGFAVPSNTMIEVYTDILTKGYVSGRPMLGITYLGVTADADYSNIARKNDLPSGSIVIASISPSSDLNNHDVKIGDIIIGVNGEELKSTDILLETIEDATVGTEIELTICRIDNKGNIDKEFDITTILVEDIGDNVVPQSEKQSNSLEDYLK